MSASKNSKQQKEISNDVYSSNNDSELKLLKMEVAELNEKIKTLQTNIELQNKMFEEFFHILRLSQIQDVRAKEKAYNLIKGNKIESAFSLFIDESRRSSLQLVSYSSRKIGLSYKKKRI